MKKRLWFFWLITLLASSGWLGYAMLGSTDRSIFLIGQTSHGHHQIEMACGACHSEPFGGSKLLQQACENCHVEALNSARDAHPKSKFTDPRNADRLAQLDARLCVTCHREHVEDQTRAMGVTLPDDFCFACHAKIAEERPSHAGMAFDTCASSGCHNFHDNRSLYEDFLIKHANSADLLPLAARTALTRQPRKAFLASLSDDQASGERQSIGPLSIGPLSIEQADARQADQTILQHWSVSAHADAGVNCSGCHQPQVGLPWQAKADFAVCGTCHQAARDTFLLGKHGMRQNPALTVDGRTPLILPPMTPAQGRLVFQDNAHNKPLHCGSCHEVHAVDTRQAAVESCLSCHADGHSLAYKDSPHFALWSAEVAGTGTPGSGVSCATCHLPREMHTFRGQPRIRVNHNQSDTLRPNEKMLRPVCLNCHGLAFALDALADDGLIRNNFSNRPSRHVPSIDMALERHSPAVTPENSKTHNPEKSP